MTREEKIEELTAMAVKYPASPCAHDMVDDEDICAACHAEWQAGLSDRISVALREMAEWENQNAVRLIEDGAEAQKG